jgi:plastocyanin
MRDMKKHALLPCLLGLTFLCGISLAHAATVTVQAQDPSGTPLADAVAYLESAQASRAVGAARPANPVEIAQVAKQFDPRVSVVPVGTMVSFPNKDSVRHHVYSFSPAKTFELKLYSGTPANPVQFDKPGVAVLGCNIHDNMVAWVVVVDTPYFARSIKAAAMVLSNVPPGNYRLRVWHPGLAVGAAALDQALVVESADNAVSVRVNGESGVKQ